MRLSVVGSVVFILNCCSLASCVELVRHRPEEDVLKVSVGRSHFSKLRKNLLKSRFRRDAEPEDPDTVPVGGKKDCVNPGSLNDQKGRRIDEFDWKFENETKLSISMSWIGKRSTGEASAMLLLATTELSFFFSAQSQLYRSDDYGKTFKHINDQVFNTHVKRNGGIMKSPVNPKKVILVSHTIPFLPSKSAVVLTEDGGETWTKHVLSFQVTGPLIFHPRQENWILARAVLNGMAYLSTDFGVNWKFLQSYVKSLKWGARTDKVYEKEERTILMTVSADVRSFLHQDAQLMRSRDLGETFKPVHVQHVYSFGLQGQFLFVSVDYNKNNNTRVMHVSKDGGDSWDPVQVPTVTPERFYSILDMSEGLIFLHVDDPGDTGKGTLYTSDADGIVFSESLKNHLYTNYLELTDFYKVTSMRGTYMTSRMNDENSVTTLISFDRGGEWNTIPMTKEQCDTAKVAVGEKCSLQIHNSFSASKGVKVPMGPLSEPNAVGIIIAHGHPGSALTSRSDIWLSRDGGYKWNKVLDGPHFYSIGDHGNLIVAVPVTSTATKYLMYSLNEGQCWFKYTFTKDDFTMTGLVTEPGAKTLRFSLWGFTLPSREWQVITVDFQHVFKKVCGSSDYDTWVPHGESKNSGCLLGKKVELQRMKPDSLCFNGVGYVHEQQTEYCPCTDADMECDYGYYRQPDTSKCKRDSTKPPDLCLHGDTTELKDKMGYRRVPGDECREGEKVVLQYLDTHQRCRNASWYDYGMPNDEAATNTKGGSSKVAIFLVIPVLLIAFGVVLYFGKKYWDLGKLRPTYRYSELTQDDEDNTDDEGTFKYNPRPKGLRAYKDYDTSDDDAAIIDL